MSCSKLHSTACLKPTHVFPFPWGLIPCSKNRLWSCSLSILKLTHLSLLINFYPPPPSWPEITIRRCKDSNTFCQWGDGSRVAEKGSFLSSLCRAALNFVCISSAYPYFCCCAHPLLHPTIQLNFCWISHMQYLHIMTGKKIQASRTEAILTPILTCWVMGKRCPKQQQKVFFWIRWVLRDMTSPFLTFPSILKSLKGLYCTTFLQNAFIQGQSMDYLPPLQQSLKLSATVVTHHLTKSSQDGFQNAMSNTMIWLCFKMKLNIFNLAISINVLYKTESFRHCKPFYINLLEIF